MSDISKWENYEFDPEILGRMMYKRAVGDAEEMECSMATCDILKRFYRPGMKLLDVGCCVGHYLRTFRERIDPTIDYKGVDPTPLYIELAIKAYSDDTLFEEGNVYELQFEDNSFDIVICNNVILNLPPPPTNAIKELVRVSRKYVIFRSLVSTSIHICKKFIPIEGETVKPEEMLSEDGKLLRFNYRNMYPVDYFRYMVEKVAPEAEFEMFRDTNWEAFDNETDLGSSDGATKTVGNLQRSEELIFDWHFGIITKP